jgi:type IV pilus assembly protein PilQ
MVISNVGARYYIQSALAAAESRAEAKTISNPMIITQNNVTGTVLQGVQIPIQTTINNTISVQFQNAALQLKVTPQVTADLNVFLNIEVDNSTVGSISTLAGPSIDTQTATTQVLVPDGGTVVFGGITVKSENKSSTGIPWVQDIPIVGHLFKNTTHITDNNELLFFVTPKILPG